MTPVLLVAAAAVGTLAWLYWLATHSPLMETAGEVRLREDREVARLDAVWALPAYDDGIHA